VKIFAMTLLALLLFIATGCAQTTTYEIARKANLEIAQSTIAESGHCSATAIGPHAILTATHCELPTDELHIRGFAAPVSILGRVRDKFDHSILYVDATFTDYVTVSSNDTLPIGTDVFVWGSPSNWFQILRKGYVAGIDHDDNPLFQTRPDFILFDFQAYPGDSGAAIFNDAGQIVAVVSMVTEREVKGQSGIAARIQFTVAIPFGFTPQTWEAACKWSPLSALAAPLRRGGQ
jgi:hypothetical protein